MNLLDAMLLSSENLLNALDRDNDMLPFWTLEVGEDYTAEYKRQWPGHNLGRLCDALLRMQAATGVAVPRDIELRMRKNLVCFFDNPDNLMLEPISDGKGYFEMCSLREAMLALTALIRYRKDSWAYDKAIAMINTLDRTLLDNGQFDVEALDYYHKAGKERQQGFYDPVTTAGRLLEALLLYYNLTHEEASIALAERIAAFHLANTLNADGSLNETLKPTHMHSYMGTLRGLFLYGVMKKDDGIVDMIAKTYEVTVRRLVKHSGFTGHDMTVECDGDIASAGDSAQLALWLYRSGRTQFIDDVERIIRSRLLPSQILSSPQLISVPGVTGDAVRDLDRRIIGGFGGIMKRHHGGKICVTDVSAACLHSLADFYMNRATRKGNEVNVTLLFDYEDDLLSISHARDSAGHITIDFRARQLCLIRLPEFAREGKITVTRDGIGQRTVIRDGVLRLSGHEGQRWTVDYALPERISQEMIQGVNYTYKWRGDEIVAVSPNDDFYPLYATL